MNDSDIDTIVKRDRKRIKRSMEAKGSDERKKLIKLLAPIIYQNGINNGNIYVDWLADQLLNTQKIKVVD